MPHQKSSHSRRVPPPHNEDPGGRYDNQSLGNMVSRSDRSIYKLGLSRDVYSNRGFLFRSDCRLQDCSLSYATEASEHNKHVLLRVDLWSRSSTSAGRSARRRLPYFNLLNGRLSGYQCLGPPNDGKCTSPLRFAGTYSATRLWALAGRAYVLMSLCNNSDAAESLHTAPRPPKGAVPRDIDDGLHQLCPFIRDGSEGVTEGNRSPRSRSRSPSITAAACALLSLGSPGAVDSSPMPSESGDSLDVSEALHRGRRPSTSEDSRGQMGRGSSPIHRTPRRRSASGYDLGGGSSAHVPDPEAAAPEPEPLNGDSDEGIPVINGVNMTDFSKRTPEGTWNPFRFLRDGEEAVLVVWADFLVRWPDEHSMTSLSAPPLIAERYEMSDTDVDANIRIFFAWAKEDMPVLQISRTPETNGSGFIRLRSEGNVLYYHRKFRAGVTAVATPIPDNGEDIEADGLLVYMKKRDAQEFGNSRFLGREFHGAKLSEVSSFRGLIKCRHPPLFTEGDAASAIPAQPVEEAVRDAVNAYTSCPVVRVARVFVPPDLASNPRAAALVIE